MISIKKFVFNSDIHLRNIFTSNKCLNEYKNVKHLDKSDENNNQNNKQMNSKSKPIERQSPQQYCMDCLKKYDFENYLSSLVLKDPSLRRNVFALKAFNAELSQIRDLTSSPLMAQIRLQYWSDLLDQVFANESSVLDINQPIAYEIQKCGLSAKLAKHWFRRLIECRMDDKNLSDFPFQTLKELEIYSESSVSSVYYLIVECSSNLNKVSVDQRLHLDHICSHLGKAQAFCNVLRGVVHNSRHNRCYIPSDLLIKHKTSHEDFLRGRPTTQVTDLCYDMASIAHQNIETSLDLMKQISAENRLIFVPIICLQNYLKRLQKTNFNVFDTKLSQRNGFLPTILWFRSKFL